MDDHSNHSTKGESLYQILELPKTSTKEEIKRKYHQLALKYHPDKNPNDPDAAKTFIKINRAHSILTDDEKRKIYDSHGSLGIHVLENLGVPDVNAYFIINSTWFKALAVFCGVITGCCFCCFCFCFCCFYFFCGLCRPRFVRDEEEEMDEDTSFSEHSSDSGGNVAEGVSGLSKQAAAEPAAAATKMIFGNNCSHKASQTTFEDIQTERRSDAQTT